MRYLLALLALACLAVESEASLLHRLARAGRRVVQARRVVVAAPLRVDYAAGVVGVPYPVAAPVLAAPPLLAAPYLGVAGVGGCSSGGGVAVGVGALRVRVRY